MPTSRAGGQALVGLVLAAAAIGALLAGRLAISILVGALSIVAYGELRGVLTPSTRAASLVVGAAAVAALLWAGYRGNLTGVPWIAAGCVLVLLAAWVVSHEVTGRPQGATEDVAGTIAAAAIVGVLGAHVLLIRAVPRVGFRGLLAFGLMVLCNDAAAFFGGRALGHRPLAPRLSPNKTAEGAMCGFLASVAVGLVVGLTLDPPFDVRAGLALGVAVGVLAPIGDLVFSALKRGGGRKESGRTFGPLGGALDAVDALLFCAPAFYWAFRTIAL